MKPPKLGTKKVLYNDLDSPIRLAEIMQEIYPNKYNDRPMHTDRYFLIPKNQNVSNAVISEQLDNKLGLKAVANSSDFSEEAITDEKLSNADALIYNELGIVLIDGNEEQAQILEESSSDYIVQREKIVYVPDEITSSQSINGTWGLNAINVLNSAFTGENVKVAVLDTGFDSTHPDFIGRIIKGENFTEENSFQDGHGHGTHCIGTACGGTDVNGLRYGVASNSIIYAGKVLNNRGSGAQASILNGILWAVKNGCQVISMSLGSPVFPGQIYDIAYENAAKFANSKGTLIVAAAGNESSRPYSVSPIGSPADSPSIIAVAAVDSNLDIAYFSNRAINPGTQIAVAAPGVNIYSSFPGVRYKNLSGTSMATPHVAGVIALLCESYPSYTIFDIRRELINLCRVLPLCAQDIGAGLISAP